MFVAWLCRSAERKDFSSAYTPLNKPILFFFSVIALSLLFSAYPKISTAAAVKYLSYGVLFFLVVNFINSRDKFDRVLKSMMIITFITSLYPFLRYLNFSWVIKWPSLRAASTFANSNFFAGFLIMMLPIAIYLYFRKQKWYYAYLPLILLMTSALICTLTRSAWIGIFIALLFIAVVNYKNLVREKKKLAMLLVLAAIVLFVFIKYLSFCPDIPSSSRENINTIVGKSFESEKVVNATGYARGNKDFEYIEFKSLAGEMKLNESRFPIHIDPSRMFNYITALRIFADNPLIGTGIGTYGYMMPDYVSSKTPLNLFYMPNIVHTHNEYLQIMAEMGLVGIISFLWIILVFFYASFYMIKTEKDDITVYLAAGVIALLVQNVFSVSLRFPTIAVFFWIFLGLAFSRQNFDKERIKKMSGKLLFFVLIALAAFSWIGGKILLSNAYVTYSRSYEGLQKAIELDPYSPEPYLSLLLQARIKDDPKMMIYALKEYNKTVPDHFIVNYHLGLAYYEAGDYDNAIYELSKVKNKRLVDEWILFSRYRKKLNLTPKQSLNITVNKIDEQVKGLI